MKKTSKDALIKASLHSLLRRVRPDLEIKLAQIRSKHSLSSLDIQEHAAIISEGIELLGLIDKWNTRRTPITKKKVKI